MLKTGAADFEMTVGKTGLFHGLGEIGKGEVFTRFKEEGAVVGAKLSVPAKGLSERIALRAGVEAHSAGNPGFGEKGVARSFGEEATAIDDADAVAQALDLLHVVSRVDDREAGAVLRLEEFEDGVAGLRVHAHGGFVAEKATGTVEEAHDKVKATLHPSGKRLHALMAAFEEVDEAKKFLPALAQFGSTESMNATKEMNVGPSAEVEVEGDLLGYKTENSPPAGGLANVLPGQADVAGVFTDEPGENVHKGGFARAIGPEKPEKFALSNLQIHSTEGRIAAVCLFEPGNGDEGGYRVSSLVWS